MMRSPTTYWLVLPLLAVLSSRGSTQESLWERVGVPGLTKFGIRTEVLGDINGDGWADLMHMVGFHDGHPCHNEFQLWILSGKDGSTLRTRPYIEPTRPFLAFTAAGDVDGDGRPDYATSISDQSQFVLRVPADGWRKWGRTWSITCCPTSRFVNGS